MGAIGGGIWHGIKGARNSPRVSASGSYARLCLPWLLARCREIDLSVRYRQLKPEHQLPVVTLVSGVGCSRPLTAQSRDTDKRRMRGTRLFQGFSLVVVLLFAVSNPKTGRAPILRNG